MKTRRRRFTGYTDPESDGLVAGGTPPGMPIYARWSALVAKDNLRVDNRYIAEFDWLPGEQALSVEHEKGMVAIIGHVDRYRKIDGNTFAEGVTYDTEQGRTATAMAVSGSLRGFSGEPFALADMGVTEEGDDMVFTTSMYTLGKMSMVSVPAWPGTGLLTIELAADDDYAGDDLVNTIMASASLTGELAFSADDAIAAPQPDATEDDETFGFGGLIASGRSALHTYKADSFLMPESPVPMPLTVFDDLSFCGHLAIYGTCHIAYPDRCVTPPKSKMAYTPAMQGTVRTDSGLLRVARMSIGSGHAAMSLSPRATADFYDKESNCAGFADVIDGELGIWIRGHCNMNAPDSILDRFASSAISGDWRKLRNHLELVGVLSVNIPGFPIPEAAQFQMVADRQVSLVAAGAAEMAKYDRADGERWAMAMGKPKSVMALSRANHRTVLDRVAKSIGQPTATELRRVALEEAAARVNGPSTRKVTVTV